MFTAVLVDDEQWALTGALQTFPLAELGFHVLLATTDSVQAARCLLDKKPDLVICDIRMPETTGLDLLRLAHEHHPDCVFILLSGYSEFSYAQEAVSLGALEYCLKPIKADQARQVLERAAQVLRLAQGGQGEAPPQTSAVFAQLLAYMGEHFREPLQQRELCEIFGLHPSYCSRLFTKHLGKRFSDHLAQLRMREAKRLLTRGEYTVSQVAEMCGYQDYFYFTKTYTKHYGISPAKARKAAAHEA